MCSRSLFSPKIRFRRPKESLATVPTTMARPASTEALGRAGPVLATPRSRSALECCWSLRSRSRWLSFLLAPILLPSSQMLLLFPAARGRTLLGRLLHELASVPFTPSTASPFLLACLRLASLPSRAPWRCVRGGWSTEPGEVPQEAGTASRPRRHHTRSSRARSSKERHSRARPPHFGQTQHPINNPVL